MKIFLKKYQKRNINSPNKNAYADTKKRRTGKNNQIKKTKRLFHGPQMQQTGKS